MAYVRPPHIQFEDLVKAGQFNDAIRDFIDKGILRPHEFSDICITYDASRTFGYLIETLGLAESKDPWKTMLLFKALDKGAQSIAMALITVYKVDPNSHNPNLNRPVHAIQIGIRENNLRIVQALIKAGAELGIIDKNKDTLSMMAARKNNLEMFKLVYRFDELNRRNDMGDAVIHLAVYANALEIIKVLVLEKGVDLNLTTLSHHETALHLACNDRKKDIARFLLERGIDPNIKNEWGEEAECSLLLMDINSKQTEEDKKHSFDIVPDKV